MPYRWTNIRLVDPGKNLDVSKYRPLSLWQPALAAAEETIQGGSLAVARAWLRLFEAHLSRSETAMLRWRGHLGENGEMRRAYSGLYGRYFARALLAAELDITDFIPLNRNTTRIPGGVEVTRVNRNDIPDWIAWDRQARCHVLCEAKGRLSESKGKFWTGKPACINAGKAQFERVEVTDSRGQRLATRDWIVANLWSTDKNKRRPISLLWDPPGDGISLTDEETRRHAAAMRRHRNASILARLHDPELIVRIVISPSGNSIPSLPTEAADDSQFFPTTRPSQEPHEGNYQAAVITLLGIHPIRSGDDLYTAYAIRERVERTGEPAMIFGVAEGIVHPAETRQLPWLSDNGIASSDGLSLFDLRNVEIAEL